jgi:hypothetical protein
VIVSDQEDGAVAATVAIFRAGETSVRLILPSGLNERRVRSRIAEDLRGVVFPSSPNLQIHWVPKEAHEQIVTKIEQRPVLDSQQVWGCGAVSLLAPR